ncbi:MAG: hypothetical protein JO247_00645 [Chloroflexi bacterium]|nr:hypothetical protein [Chloroflexota bacterium]
MRIGRLAASTALGLAALSGAAVLLPGRAAACAIAPGTNTCAPDVLTVSPSATQVATATNTINVTDPSSGATINATYTENVYRDPTNTYCANCLTWVVKVANSWTSTDTVERVTVSNFAGFSTDIGTDSNGAPGMTDTGTQSPVNVERNTSGSVLAWDFNTSGSEIQPGQTSHLLEIETNATQYKPGTVTVQDGVAGSGPGFGPVVPEVVFVPALAAAGGAAFGLFRWRRRRASATLTKP